MDTQEKTKIDLNSLTIQELTELQLQTDEVLKGKLTEQAQANIEHIVELIVNNKVPFVRLIRAIRNNNAIFQDANKDGCMRKIYVNKNNPLDLFDGVGRKPKWFKELEESGANLDENLLILEGN